MSDDRDIVERLRDYVADFDDASEMVYEAAAEIERLREAPYPGDLCVRCGDRLGGAS